MIGVESFNKKGSSWIKSFNQKEIKIVHVDSLTKCDSSHQKSDCALVLFCKNIILQIITRFRVGFYQNNSKHLKVKLHRFF